MHVRSNLHYAIKIPFRNFFFNPTCRPVSPQRFYTQCITRKASATSLCDVDDAFGSGAGPFMGRSVNVPGCCVSGTIRCLFVKNWVKNSWLPWTTTFLPLELFLFDPWWPYLLFSLKETVLIAWAWESRRLLVAVLSKARKFSLCFLIRQHLIDRNTLPLFPY